MPEDLLAQSSHFAFGDNWSSFANEVSEAQIADAILGLSRLVGGRLDGKRFLDIGCGSGIHALAALRIGAAEVTALDIDPMSVETSRQLLQRFASGERWSVKQVSVFDLNAAIHGTFDVVYSWGVLHHTGAIHEALRKAVGLVAPGGQFVFALYRRTRLCWLWKIEKRWYANAGAFWQRLARAVYVAFFRLRMFGRFNQYVSSYKNNRGMDFHHDVHDWLGGWPYESISPSEVEAFMQRLQFKPARVFLYPKGPLGLFGTGCDEFAYIKSVEIESGC